MATEFLVRDMVREDVGWRRRVSSSARKKEMGIKRRGRKES